ncbi:hypothetical protein HDU80_001284 [Chytriomyces hyalinus]|nr:hypothetical protein HDU80_001284 [Chytriomyces hyalinus]
MYAQIALTVGLAVTAVQAQQDTSTLSLVNSAINGVSPCGVTCLNALPNWVTPITLDAITKVCADLQNNFNLFSACISTGCNATELKPVVNLVSLVPNGCRALGINTNATIPKVVIPSVSPSSIPVSTTAATTSKSAAGQVAHTFGILAVAVTFSALLF